MKSNLTIFLVDDDVDDREIFALALAEVDPSYACVTAKNGMEAVDKLKSGNFVPNYIFLDLNMPVMNGKQCLSEIRKRNDLDLVPIVIYTTSSENSDKDETLRLGATAFVTKPPGIGELVRSLQNIFSMY